MEDGPDDLAELELCALQNVNVALVDFQESGRVLADAMRFWRLTCDKRSRLKNSDAGAETAAQEAIARAAGR